jgi:hypothetical protein
MSLEQVDDGLTVVVMVYCFVDCCDKLFGVVGMSTYVSAGKGRVKRK